MYSISMLRPGQVKNFHHLINNTNKLINMGKEIERKYLVSGEYKSLAHYSITIKQAYISSDKKEL